MSTLKDLRDVRIDKLNKLRDLGIDPYPAKSEKDVSNAEVADDFEKYDGKELSLTGRIISWREHGSLIFADLKDQSGKIQLYIKSDLLADTNSQNQTLGFNDLALLDVGDFIQAKGLVTKTQRGEVSLQPTEIKVLVKTLRPLPDKHDGLKDRETRQRRRYLDTTVNEDTQARYLRRSKFWEAHRDFFRERGFVEINIPVLEHIPGGGDANPFVTHMDSIDEDFYLRISQELYLKRLIGGGYEKVYEIGPRFRNEGLSDEHLPEHMAMEFYWAYADWEDGMKFIEDLYNYVIEQVYGDKKVFNIRGHEVSFSGKWERLDFGEIMKTRYGFDVYTADLGEVNNALSRENLDPALNVPRGIDTLWKQLRVNISGPAFLINHPKYLSPLQKPSKDNENIVERFQPIIAGSELGNGWSEVNDPIDQFERFSEQQAMRDSGDQEAQWLDVDYVEMLEYGMPPTFGYGHSERVFWFLEDVPAREGVPFPQMKYRLDETTKAIYNLSDNIAGRHREPQMETLDISEKIQISQSVKQKWPDFRVGYAELSGLNIAKENKELETLKAEHVDQFALLTKGDLDNFREIRSYREAYKEMGVSLHSRKPSPEALLNRVVKGKELYTVNTCIDALNLIVMKYRVSIGAFDLNNIVFPVEVCIADGGEEITLLGDEKPTDIRAGEVCYFDTKGPFNLDINYRDADRTRVTTNTKRIMLNVDGLNGITRSHVEQSLKEAVDLILKFCGGNVETMGIVE